MAVGLVKKNKIFYSKAKGIKQPVIYVGSKTGRDGIHGASMASTTFDEKIEEKKPTVQVGDPFTEKLLLEACLELMVDDSIIAIQDMGAAGLTSSSVEMASKGKLGIELDLDKVPCREKNMTPYEMMLSESQERMLIILDDQKENEAKKIFKKNLGENLFNSLINFCSNPNDICKALYAKGFVEMVKKHIRPKLAGLTFDPIYKDIQFTKDQSLAIKNIVTAIDSNQFKSFLLHGVTGSGKTEIYIEAARHVLKKNKTVIILLPEIALTPQIAGRFKAVFGEEVAIWHSKLSQSARSWTWKKICLGEYKVVIGARSSIFVPLKNIGMIIVDEEQEDSYKQESPDPRYHARDVALIRGKINKATETGDGPVDAIFKCVKKLYPHDVKLQLYQVHAVTEGTDAQATVSVRIEENGKTTVGQAADTDTLVASANAYLNALNKMIIKRKKTAPDEQQQNKRYQQQQKMRGI